jgi:hypothetical protein
MCARQSLMLAHSLADDARRRAEADRRASTPEGEDARGVARGAATVRPWLARLIRPMANWPGAAG